MHSKLKKFIRNSGNWINTCYTISNKFARSNCVIDKSNINYNFHEIQIIDEYIRLKLNITSGESFFETNKFFYNGMAYRLGMAIIVENGPKFLLITKILKYNDKIYFCGNKHDSVSLSSKNAFVLEDSFTKELFQFDFLKKQFQSYEVYRFDNKDYIFPFFQVLHHEFID